MTRGNSFYHVSTFLWHFDIIFIIVSILIRFRSAKGSPWTTRKTIERGSIFYWGYYASLSFFEYTTKGHLFCPLSRVGWGLHFNPFYVLPFAGKNNKNFKGRDSKHIFFYQSFLLTLIRFSINSFSSKYAEFDEYMTNVKLIIYLSQSHTLNLPHHACNNNKYFIYVSQLFYVIAKILPRVMNMSGDICKQGCNLLKGFRERIFLLWKLIRRLRLFVNNKSRLSRLNPSFVADFLGIIVFVTVSHLRLCSVFL